MKIICLNPEGINKYEVDANVRMEKEFSSKWRGYSALELIDIREGTKEIDFVLVTEDRVVLLELKNWNGLIKFDSGKWYHNGQERSSPVKITANKARILRTHVEKYGIKPPYIEHRIILCGNANLENFPIDEKNYVIKLDEFLKIKEIAQYKKVFPKETYSKVPDLGWFDNFFNVKNGSFKPRQLIYQNYRTDGDSTFNHPQGYYKEYLAIKKDDKNYQALLRRWDLTEFGQNAITQEDRADIVLRENKVLGFIKSQRNEYKDYYLQPLSSSMKEEVTADFCELYELPHRQLRLNEFINKYQEKLQLQDRVDLIKVLLSHFADLHDIEVAHRDISEHCLWLERPTKISISGFITAYFREAKTVGLLGDIIKVGSTKLPEDVLGDSLSNPFRRDVFLLTIVSYFILHGRYPTQDDGLCIWQPCNNDIANGKLNEWFEKGMDLNAQSRFKDAREMLEAFNKVKFIDVDQDISLSYFEKYRIDKRLHKLYDVVEEIKDSSGCEIYISEKENEQRVIVKKWDYIFPEKNNSSVNYALYCFFEKLQTLKNSNIDFIPKIIDFGIALKDTFFVQEYIVAETFDNYLQSHELSLIERLALSVTLIDVVSYLHGANIYHGDLHPKNILIANDDEGNDFKLYLIDIVEYREGAVIPYNTAYAPISYETAQPCEIDCYAVVALICDVLQLNRNNLCSDTIPQLIVDSLQHFFDTPPFLTLEQLKKSFEDYLSPPKLVAKNNFEVTFSMGLQEQEELLSSNGNYYVSAQASNKNNDEILVFVTGAGKKLTLIIKKEDFSLSWAKVNEITHSEFLLNIKNSNTILEDATIKIANSAICSADTLILWLKGLDCIKSIVMIDEEEQSDISSIYFSDNPVQEISTRRIWEAILSKEKELSPEADVTGNYEIIGSQLHIPCILDFDCDSGDKVEVIYLEKDIEKKIGILNIKKTDPENLVIDDYKNQSYIKVGVKLKLINQQTKSSYQRRKNAIERILDGKSIIRDLADYFDLNQVKASNSVLDDVTDEDLNVYDIYDDNGDVKFSLNAQQRDAFRQLYKSPPLSLLQGPPGTGKTAFIASFIHYIVKKGTARNILLVSQSHEAVNNAIEGIDKLCQRNKLDLDIVRFGAEGMLSDAIQHLHISAIQYKYRETFKASIKARVVSLSSNLGLTNDFVGKYFDVEFYLSKLNREIIKLQDNDEKTQQLNQRLEDFYRVALEKFNFCHNEGTTVDVIELIKRELCNEYRVSSNSSLKKLDNIIAISFEWIDVLAIQGSKNRFEEFLAKTRTLVCGTCVGIGQWHIGVANNQYDWVIIDEAARATASELAIAMQAGKRVLLVGDHKQLRPQYNPPDLIKHVSRSLQADENIIQKSDFERAFQSDYGKKVGATLTTQYRMTSAIGSLVSECFYENKLKHGRDKSKSFYEFLPKPLAQAEVIWMDTSSYHEKSYEIPIVDGGYYNRHEIDVIIHLLKDIANSEQFIESVNSDLKDSEKVIGVICMYAEQKQRIRDKVLETVAISSEFKKLIKIDTVDSYQGKENGIIILSLTRNNQNCNQGFLNDIQRINVAFSRAKDRLVIVGATKMWDCQKNMNTPLGLALKFIQHQNSNDYLIYDTMNYEKTRN